MPLEKESSDELFTPLSRIRVSCGTQSEPSFMLKESLTMANQSVHRSV